jgi:dihydrofolate reductase
VFIVSHSVPSHIPEGGVYTFVDSIEAAFEKAQQAAGEKDIGLSGANVPQQFIERGLVDEIFIHLVPVLFGNGIRLIENLAGGHVQLEIAEVIETKEVVHLRFRVIK